MLATRLFVQELQAPETAAKIALPMKAVLGLRDPVREDLARLRGLQNPHLITGKIVRLIAQLIAAALVSFLSYEFIHPIGLIAWALALGFSLAFNAKVSANLADPDGRDMSAADFRKHGISIVAIGLIWSVPILWFGILGGGSELLVLWAIIAALIVGSSLNAAATPLATIVLAWLVLGEALNALYSQKTSKKKLTH